MLFGIEWDTGSDWAFALSILPILLTALLTTLKAAAAGFALALALGLALAALKGVPARPVRWPAALVVEFLRDTPLLIQLFFVFYVLPEWTGWAISPFVAGALALGLQYSAYCAEVYRGGIEAVPHGQREAIRVLGLRPLRGFSHVILPQAVPRVIPALGNYAVSILKDVPVLSVVTVLEMFGAARIIGDRTFNYLIPLSMVGGLYLILTLLASLLVRQLDLRLPKRGIALK